MAAFLSEAASVAEFKRARVEPYTSFDLSIVDFRPSRSLKRIEA